MLCYNYTTGSHCNQVKTRPPKIILYDIETAPILSHVWEMHETNVANVVLPTYMLSFSFKELGKKKVTTYALPDFSLYKSDKQNDKALVTKLHEVLSSAEIIVGHNSDSFDNKKSNSRFIVHGLQPLNPHKSIDTLKIARKHFKFDSNKLDNLGKYLGVGKKIAHTGMHLWVSCMSGDLKAWRMMKKYNAQDVRLLEAVYLKLRPWATQHPDLRVYDDFDGCPTCRSKNVVKRGSALIGKKIRQAYACKDCGTRYAGDIV